MELPETRIPGLVWAHHFDPGRGACSRVPPDVTVEELLSRGGFAWLHLGLSDIRVPALIAGLPGMTPDAVQALSSRDAHAILTVAPDMVCGTLVDFQDLARRLSDEPTCSRPGRSGGLPRSCDRQGPRRPPAPA